MGEEGDYTEPGSPRRSPLPAVILWTCVGVLALAIFGAMWLQVTALTP